MKPGDKSPKRPTEPAWTRVMFCAAMLTIHGFMTAAERRKVDARIEAWLSKHGPAPGQPPKGRT